jgi:hypothetical protein
MPGNPPYANVSAGCLSKTGSQKPSILARPVQVRRQLHAFGAALLHARQPALLQGMLRLAGPLANDPALQLLQVQCRCFCEHAVP